MLTENANRVSFDDRLNQQARVEDLSRELMCDFLKEVGSDLADRTAQLPLVELGRQMNVVSGSVEAPFPLNVGLLFFNPEPHRFFFFPATQIDVVWLPKGAGGEKITERVFRGPAPKMLRARQSRSRSAIWKRTQTTCRSRWFPAIRA